VNDDVEVTVWDKTFTRTGWVGDPVQVVATPRHNQQPTASITLRGDDPKVTLLAAPGARAVIRYRGEHLVGGPVRSWRSEGNATSRVWTFEVEDDWRLLTRVLLWPVPTAAITAQTSPVHKVTGPAETVVKTFLQAAVTRLALPVTIATDQGRGDTITAQARFDTPADLLGALVDQAGIGVSVQQGDGGLVVDCYETSAWPITLSEDGGTLTDVTYTASGSTVTRVVGGFDGEDEARTFRTRVDGDRETTSGDLIEQFVDARDLKHDDTTFTTDSTARMAAAITAGAPTTGLHVSLNENGTFTYGGRGVHVGDTVTIALTTGVTVTDVLRSATLTWSASGVRVTPQVGDRTDDPTLTLARAVAAVARQQRRLHTGS